MLTHGKVELFASESLAKEQNTVLPQMQSPRPGFMRRFSVRVPALVVAGALALAANAQNFVQPKVILVGNWPTAIYTADINGDGIPDLIYIDSRATATASTTHVLLGNSKGNYTETAVLATAGPSVAIYPAGNGHLDIAWLTGTTEANMQLHIALGKGDGTFYPTMDSGAYQAPGLNPKPMQWGYLGLAYYTNSLNQVNFIAEDVANNTLWTFGAYIGNFGGFPNAYFAEGPGAIPDGAGPVAMTDINGDGKADIVIAGQSGFAADIFLQQCGFGFCDATRFAPSTGVHSLLLQDVNGDGRPDLIAEGVNGRIDVFAGNGDGTFQTTSIGGTGTLDGTTGNGGHLIATGDFNHDGLIDALTATPAGVSTLLGNGTQYLGLKGIYNGGPGHSTYAVADFNGDGNLDLALDSPEGIAILYGNSDGSFQTSQAFAAGQPAMSGALGVYTSSGNIDAVVSTGSAQAQLLEGQGNGMFLYNGSPSSAVPTTSKNGESGVWSVVQAGDFNGDGNLDLLLTADRPAVLDNDPGNGVVLQEGSGQDSFTFPYAVDPPAVSNTCFGATAYGFGVSAVADFNGDGIPDFAVRDNAKTDIYLGQRGAFPVLAQFFLSATVPVCEILEHNIAVAGNFGPSNAPDLLVEENGHLLLYLNDGSGKLQSPNGGDLAVDGSLTTPGQLIAPLLNATVSPTLGFPAAIGSAAVADLDGDGNQDLIVTYANLSANLQAPAAAAPNYIYIWFGSGGGKFLTSAKHPANPVRLTPSRNFYQVAVADMNADGIPDLILSDGYILSVQLGNGDSTFGSESHYLAGQGINSISAADLNGDGKPDLVIANGGAVLSNPVANLDTLATNPDVNTGGVTVLINHFTPTLTPITGATLTASPEPSEYGNPFSITVAFPPLNTNITGPTGTVTFAIDGTTFGSAIVVSSTATVNVPAYIYDTLAVGNHALTATYSGDANYSPGNLTGTHTVSLIPTAISLILCVDPPGSNFPCGNPISSTPLISPITMYVGQSVDGVAVESAINLTGTITFYSGSTIFCQLNANLQAGSNICPPQAGFFPPGTSTVTVVYSGDSTHAPSTSNGIVVIVLPDTTTATLTSSLNPSGFGQPVTFTTNVQGNFETGAGQVIFIDGTTTLNTATLDATGAATFTTSTLSVGTHPIHVAFPGSASFVTTNSPTVNQVVTSTLSTVQSVITLTSSIDPSAPGQAVTFTATVTAPGPFPIVPNGTVNFLDGTTVIGSGRINTSTGIATFTTSTLAPGSHPITASYAGSAGLEGTGPVPPPNPPEPPGAHLLQPLPASGGFRVIGPAPHATVVQPPAFFAAPSAKPAPIPAPQPRATASTPTILPSTSAELTQVVTYSLGAEAPGFVLTVTPVPVTVQTGATAILLVSVRDASGFNQPVQLSCAGLPNETTCTFVTLLIPAGGGSTTLQVVPAAPHDCGVDTPYLGANSTGSTMGSIAALAFPGLLAALGGFRRRRRIRALLLVALSLCGLAASAAISGCGHCTDLGTKPGSYTFSVVGTAQGGPITQTQTQVISMTVTIP
jgi:hypothetical protein